MNWTEKELAAHLRSNLQPRRESKQFDAWIRRGTCFYAGKEWGACQGEIVADHVLPSFAGMKANGYFKVAACVHHNGRAEQVPEMHPSAIIQAIKNLANYTMEQEDSDCSTIRNR